MSASPGEPAQPDAVCVVLADANVLYSRVLRDYLLYAADQQIVSVAWSPRILAEVAEHLIANLPRFDAAAGERLRRAMNAAFPFAEVEPTEEHVAMLEGVRLRDEGDRHVMAAGIAADATVLCTANVRDFPAEVMDNLGFEVLTPDQLFTRLVSESPGGMIAAHHIAVASLPGATDLSTLDALRRAGAPRTAELMAELLGV